MDKDAVDPYPIRARGVPEDVPPGLAQRLGADADRAPGGARHGPRLHRRVGPASSRSGRGGDPAARAAATRGRRRRRVLELLLGAEQRVEHLLAQILGERQREAGRDEQHQQLAAERRRPSSSWAARGRLLETSGRPP